jgi:mono/diheme cytochrome c family protein
MTVAWIGFAVNALVSGLTAGLVATAAPAETTPDEAKQLYGRYCGSCHGATGNGRGPVASVLETPPSNLTKLSEKYGSPLPREKILAYIDGREAVAAHGPREMPVWGRRLRIMGSTLKSSPSDEEVQAILEAIYLHLEAIQPGGERAPKTSLP